MAVRADHLALLHFVEEALPASPGETCADGEELVAEVVELEHDRIVLPTVTTRVAREELDEECGSLEHQLPPSNSGLIDVPLAVSQVVLLLIGGSARPAEGVPLVPLLSPPCELLGRFALTASAATLLG
jgi:hypothetical protein